MTKRSRKAARPSVKAKPSKPEPKAQLKDKNRSAKRIGDGWKVFWAFAGPIFTLVGAYTYWAPSLTIQTGANLDPSQTMQTQFVLTNTGHVPVYDVIFACGVFGPTSGLGKLSVSTEEMQKVDKLPPGTPVSRACVKESQNVFGATLKVEAFYKWPLIGQRDKVEAYFTVRRGTSGFFLVPDVSPNFPSDPESLTPK